MKRLFNIVLALLLAVFFTTGAIAGINDRFSDIDLTQDNYIRFDEISAPSGDPVTNDGWLYVKDSGGTSALFFEDDTGTVTNLVAGAATAWDDIADPDAAGTIAFTTYMQTLTSTATATDGLVISGLGDFADVSVVRIEQKTGNPTNGTVLEVISADAQADALLVTANATSVIQVLGTGAIGIDGLEFDVDATTGAVTINDGGDAGSVTVEGSILDINSLTFVGAGEIKTAAASALTLSADDGATAAEDLIIVANNVSLTAVGLLTMSPDNALAIAIDAADADIATALSVGANDIVGTTGLINYTNFDVDAAGAVVATAIDAGAGLIQTTGDITCAGTVTGATIAQDAIIAVTANTNLDLDGSLVTGGVDIGTVGGTGAITMGGVGHSTSVELPASVDLTMAQGDLSITDTANGDLVTLVNNTVTTNDIIDISATGVRTAGGAIKIVDGATAGDVIVITANSQTTGSGFSYTNTGAALTGAAIDLAITDGAGFTGDYFRCFDGAAEDFTIERYGETTIAGTATGTAALTLNAGDITVTSGDVDIVLGEITVNSTIDSQNVIARNIDTTTGPLLQLTNTNVNDDDSVLELVNNITGSAEITLEMSTAAAGAMVDGTMTNAAADGIALTPPASYTGQLITSALGAWLGTTGEGGVIDVVTTAAATQEVGQGVRLNYLGTGVAGTAVQGKGLHVHANAGAKAGESLVYLDTLFNDAIHINNAGVSADGIKFDVPNAYVGQGFVADLGEHVGTVTQGFIDLTTDSAATDVAGMALRINLQDTAVDTTAISGKGIYAKEVSAYKLGTFLTHFESTSNGSIYASGAADFSAAPFLGASPFIFEGATVDTEETTISVTDPEVDTTINIPDVAIATAEIPLVVAVGTTQVSEGTVATADVTGGGVTLPADHAAAGQLYTWVISGTKTGANATFDVVLYALDGAVMTLTSSDAAALDWVARFSMYITAGATQDIHGELICNGKVAVSDFATGAKDLATAGGDIKAQISNGDVGDTTTAETVRITYNE